MADRGKRGSARIALAVAALVVVVAGVVAVLVVAGNRTPVPPAASSPPGTTASASTSPSATVSHSPSTATPPTPATSAPNTTPPATTPPATTTPATSAPASSAVPGVPAALRGQDVERIPTTRKVVALTFDAGANSAGLESILGTLAREKVTATFFLTGTWAGANGASVERIAAAGHRIGNHSQTHPEFTRLSDTAIRSELRRAQDAIAVAGADPRPLFRFPFGDRDARTIATVNAAGYLPVRWSVDTLGWKGTSGGMSADAVRQRALAGLAPGEIVLMHIGSNPDDGSTLDADALPGMIEAMRDAGYGFVTLDDLL